MPQSSRTPRPPNGWIIFLGEYSARRRAQESTAPSAERIMREDKNNGHNDNGNPGEPQARAKQEAKMSSAASAEWWALPNEVRHAYNERGHQLSLEHAIKHPDYKLRPRTEEEKREYNRRRARKVRAKRQQQKLKLEGLNVSSTEDLKDINNTGDGNEKGPEQEIGSSDTGRLSLDKFPPVASTSALEFSGQFSRRSVEHNMPSRGHQISSAFPNSFTVDHSYNSTHPGRSPSFITVLGSSAFGREVIEMLISLDESNFKGTPLVDEQERAKLKSAGQLYQRDTFMRSTSAAGLGQRLSTPCNNVINNVLPKYPTVTLYGPFEERDVFGDLPRQADNAILPPECFGEAQPEPPYPYDYYLPPYPIDDDA